MILPNSKYCISKYKIYVRQARESYSRTEIHYGVWDLGSDFKSQTDYKRIDLIVVCIANFINVIMTILFIVRIFGLSQEVYVLGIVVMIMGFVLGHVAFLNKKNERDKWEVYLLIPIFLFFIVDLFLDYLFPCDFRSTQ
jgi:hypothetical protein